MKIKHMITTKYVAQIAGALIVVLMIYIFFTFLQPQPVFDAKASASLQLSPNGYMLVVNISLPGSAKLLAASIGNIYSEYPYLVSGSTTIEIPLGSRAPSSGDGALIFEKFNIPFKVTLPSESQIYAAYDHMRGLVALLGYSASGSVIYAFPAPISILVVSQYGFTPHRFLSAINITHISPDKLKRIPDGYEMYIFVDIYPSKDLLMSLSQRASVAIVPYMTMFGEKRLELVDGELQVREYSPEASDIDYFGLHCWRQYSRETYVIKMLQNYPGPEISSLIPIASARGYMLQSSTCMQFVKTPAVVDDAGNVVAFYSDYGFIASLDPDAAIALAAMRIWEGKIYRVSVPSFGGYYLLGPLFHHSIVVTDLNRFFVVSSRYNINYSISSHVSIEVKEPINTTIYTISLSGDLVSVENISIASGSVIQKQLGYIYLLKIANEYYAVIAVPPVDPGYISVSVYGSCELGSIEVLRIGGSGRLSLYISGVPVGYIDPDSRLSLSRCFPGHNSVAARDSLGMLRYYSVFYMPRIYETPQFIVMAVFSLLLAAAVVVRLFRRGGPRYVSFYILEAPPKFADRSVEVGVVENTLSLFEKYAKRSAISSELFSRIKGAYGDMLDAMLEALSTSRIRVFYDYLREVGDTITVISSSRGGLDPRVQMIKIAVSIIANRYGVNVNYDIYSCDVVLEKDKNILCVIAAADENMIYTPRGRKEVGYIERVFKAFVEMEEIAEKIGGSFAGISIVSLDWIDEVINNILIKLMTEEATDLAERMMIDVKNYSSVKHTYMDRIFEKKIFSAANYRDIIPLIVLFISKKYMLCNRYYLTKRQS